MTMMITFKVDADPVGKQRARYAKRGNHVMAYTPDKTRNYESLIREAAIEAMGSGEPLETPVTLYLYIRAPIPKSLPKKRIEACLNGLEKPIKKPDASNVLKSVEDAMNGVVYKDDSQIVNIHVSKVYSSVSGVDVCIKECLD
jgi:Holliday junction resolvase RusA-like endonuclease